MSRGPRANVWTMSTDTRSQHQSNHGWNLDPPSAQGAWWRPRSAARWRERRRPSLTPAVGTRQSWKDSAEAPQETLLENKHEKENVQIAPEYLRTLNLKNIFFFCSFLQLNFLDVFWAACDCLTSHNKHVDVALGFILRRFHVDAAVDARVVRVQVPDGDTVVLQRSFFLNPVLVLFPLRDFLGSFHRVIVKHLLLALRVTIQIHPDVAVGAGRAQGTLQGDVLPGFSANRDVLCDEVCKVSTLMRWGHESADCRHYS